MELFHWKQVFGFFQPASKLVQVDYANHGLADSKYMDH